MCGPTPVAHTMKAYKKLPRGWQPRPKQTPSDLFMWRQWLSQPWCKFYTESAVTTLHFASPQRREWSIGERVAELEQWWQRISQPNFREWIEREWRYDWQKRTERVNYYATLGDTLLKHKEYSLAEQMYRKAYEAEKKGRFCSLLSRALWLQDKQEESLKILKEATQLEKYNCDFHIHLGNMLIKMEKHSEAIQAFTKALELQQSAILYFYIGQCHQKLSNYKQAKIFVKKAIVLEPKSQKFKWYLRRLWLKSI